MWQPTDHTRAVVGGLAVLAGAFGAGAVTATLITKKVLETKYNEIAQQEIEEAKTYYRRLNKREEFANPNQLALDITSKIIANQGYSEEVIDYTKVDEPEDEDVVIQQNIFIQNQDTPEWDWDAELAQRDEDNPYIIHHDEFQQGEKDYDQITLTYFEGDDILCDDKDEVVSDVDLLVGNANLSRFGHGSKDNNVLYVRCDHLDTDFEIVRRKGRYTQEVLGFIEHSEDHRRPRKFRRDYE